MLDVRFSGCRKFRVPARPSLRSLPYLQFRRERQYSVPYGCGASGPSSKCEALIFVRIVKFYSLSRALRRNVVVAVMTIWGCGRMPEASAQVNSWTNPASGYWEEQNWSLGTLPGPEQSILLTNAGWKALAIGPNTVRDYPQTLSIDSLTVSSPIDSFNVLLSERRQPGVAVRQSFHPADGNECMRALFRHDRSHQSLHKSIGRAATVLPLTTSLAACRCF